MAPSSLATLVVAALLALAFVAQAAQPKPLTVETVHKMKRVSAHAVNSRGSIAWSERTWQRVIKRTFSGPALMPLFARIPSRALFY